MTASVSVVVFGMLEHGHIKRLLPIVSGLAQAGMTVHVFVDRRFHDEVAAAGGRPLDLFRDRPLDRADASSIPIPCRYVSFAGHYADSILAEVAALRPALVVHDTFAVIGPVVAHHFGIPRVNVCVGHNHAPVPTLESLANNPRVAIAQDCWRAVRLLRERHGMPDASPFSYVTSLSRTLNLYCEPPAFLRHEERLPFEPLAFVGSLSESTLRRELGPSPFGAQAADKLRLYVSFGTVIWRYYEAVAKATLEVIAEAVSAMPSVAALVSLGRAELGTWSRSLARPNFQVERYVDQWSTLGHASLFITHHGLNSTHEAIAHQVPMISYPFFADQPALARRCQELDLAEPLTSKLRGSVSVAEVQAAINRVVEKQKALRARLAQARTWELEVMAARGQVIERIRKILQT